MAKEAIIEKLEKVLTNNVESEAQVVYILTRARKILDMNYQKQKYSAINFYCNWSLHFELTHSGPTSYMTSKFDPHINITKSGKSIADDLISSNQDFFKLDDLKSELRRFCKEYGLATVISDDAKKWHTFMRLLLEIIRDCPIVIKKSKINKITLIGSNLDEYSYVFSLVGSREKPKVKLKLKV